MAQRGSEDRGFVGRQREMALLTAAMADVLGGQGRLAMLAGEPGIGKTRMAQELASYVESDGGLVLWGRCSSAQGAPPYWPWVQVIRSYVKGHDAARLNVEMGLSAADIAEIVPELKLLLPELIPAPVLEPEQARFRLFDSITNFLKSASQTQPLMLVMEDLHWADQPSLLMLEFLAREISQCRLLVVGTYRDTEVVAGHPLNQTLGELAREPAFPQVFLGGLDEQDEGQFIELAAGFEPPSDLVKAVHAMAEGNPLFLTEVVRLLVDSGQLDAESVARSQEWSFKIPSAVNAVIRSRLDRLSDDCQQVIGVAALTGRDFDLGLLEWLITDERVEIEAEVSAGELLGLLEEALAARVIEEVPELVGRYQFSHALIQETLSGQPSSVRRAMMHASIGQALVDRFQDGADEHAAEIAYHFGRAETVTGHDKMAHYSLLAGQQALAAYAVEDALMHFERGLAARNITVSDSMVAPDEEAAALLFGLGQVQQATLPRHRLGEVQKAIKPAFDYYVSVGDLPHSLAITDFIGIHLVRGPKSVEIITEALGLVPPGSPESGRVLSRYADILASSRGDRAAATDALDQALEIAQRENDAVMEINVLVKMASLHYTQIEYEKSLGKCLLAIELITGVSQPPDTPVYWYAVRDLIALGRIEDARPYAARQLELAEKSRSRYLLTQALHSNGFLAYLAGNWETAREFSDRGLEKDGADVRLLSMRSDLENKLGDFAAGDRYIERIMETIRNLPPGVTQLDHTVITSTICVAARITGNVDRFDIDASASGRLLSIPSGVEPRIAQIARTGLALLAMQTDDVSAAEEQYSFLKSWPTSRTPLILIDGDRVLGLLAQTIGDQEAAVNHFEDSLTFCRKAGYRPELAEVCCDYADTLLARGKEGDSSKAKSLLEESLAISADLGMVPLSARVTARLDSSVTKDSTIYPDGLTGREVEVLQLICGGKTDREIGEELYISFRTVGNHVRSILNKTATANRTEATNYANQHGLVTPGPTRE